MQKWFFVIFAVLVLKPIAAQLLAGKRKSGGSDPSAPSGTTAQRAEAWSAVAQGTGLRMASRKKNQPMVLRGAIDGHKVTVVGNHRGPEIEVDFYSGIGRIDIRPIDQDTKVHGSITPVTTGDHIFDSQIRVLSPHSEQALLYLTPLRRETILALHTALIIDEIDDDELEVYFPGNKWTPAELEDAIRLTVQAATILDRNHPTSRAPTATLAATPQDVVRQNVSYSPQDQVRH